jgi:hypothetical protein
MRLRYREGEGGREREGGKGLVGERTTEIERDGGIGREREGERITLVKVGK